MALSRKKTKRKKRYISKKQQRKLKMLRNIGLTLLLVSLLGGGAFKIYQHIGGDQYREIADENITAEKPEIMVDLLEVNEYSRPGEKSDRIEGIVVHYTANPGTSAKQNRNYFNNLKDTHETKASSHFIIGIEGEIIQCVPTWELAYASNGRNHDTVSIECCHPDESGKFTKETYVSLVQLTAWLCEKFDLEESAVIRHYDITGKNCPKYFVENETEWEKFKTAVANARNSGYN